MPEAHRQPILVTGSHRSGSTWVGRILGLSTDTGYIHEPFRPGCPPGICNAGFQHWFTYITRENETPYYQAVKNTLEFRYNLWAQLKTIRNVQHLRQTKWDYQTFAEHRAYRQRTLIKDPITLLSAPWLVDRFDMAVVVLIRHPAAFAGSLKRLDWTFPFDHFLQQPLLMRDHLEPFRAEITEYANREQDIINQSALLWKVLNSVVLKYRQRFPNWIFLRHEDLSNNPVRHFEDLFQRLNLEFTPEIRDAVQAHSAASNPKEAPKTKSVKLNSKANIHSWKKRLSPDEIRCIREQVGEVAQEFYSDADWE